jgi:hypothetical protein
MAALPFRQQAVAFIVYPASVFVEIALAFPVRIKYRSSRRVCQEAKYNGPTVYLAIYQAPINLGNAWTVAS